MRERVTEIENRPHVRRERDARRRSRSPLPEVLRRQMNPLAERAPPDTMGGPARDLPDEFYEARPRSEMEYYRKGCHIYNEDFFRDLPREQYGELPIEVFLELFPRDEDGDEQMGEQVWATEQSRNGEITWSQMTPEEIAEFHKSDRQEWKDLEEGFKAVKVWRGEEAQDLRNRYRHRIMTSRMVRRKKPMPGLHQFKAKSRFCVHGHKDPDGGTFRTFAPTPSTEAFNMVCQIIANEDMRLLFADVKAAFAQSDRLVRPRGRLFVEPCDGVPLDKGDLIELVQPVYGLDDAPLRWHETVTSHLRKMGLRKSLLDPCIYVRHDAQGELELLILIEVDDFVIASRTDEIQEDAKQDLQSRFRFGKWEVDEAEFIGRHVKKEGREIKLDQEKYIVEKIEAVPLSKGRRSHKEAELSEEEFSNFRSMLYRISWLAHQTRPEASGVVSILSSRLHRATVNDVIMLNKMVGHLRSTARQPLRIRGFNKNDMKFIGISDAGGIDGDITGLDKKGLPEDPVQGAWLVLGSNMLPAHDLRVQVSVLSWRSSKLKRRVTSTMAGETLSMSQCLGEVEWMQVFYRDLAYGDVQVKDWHRSLSPYTIYLPEECELVSRQEQGQITDAKSLYDAIYKQCPASRQDRRTALELAVIVDSAQKAGSQIRWAPHQRMPVDMLTKVDIGKTNGALLHLLRTGMLRIDKEEVEMMRRQRDESARSRTRGSSERLLAEEEAYFMKIVSNLVWST